MVFIYSTLFQLKKVTFSYIFLHIFQSNIISDEKEFQPCGDVQIFENEWMEIEVKPPLNWGFPISTVTQQVPNSFSNIETGVPHFLCEEIDASYSDCDLEGKDKIY